MTYLYSHHLALTSTYVLVAVRSATRSFPWDMYEYER
jgi:hypothetical protein